MSNKIPIVIVSSTYFAKEAPIIGNWFNLQKQWLNQNRNSQIFKVLSGHFIQHDKPKLICEQLNKLVVTAITGNDSKTIISGRDLGAPHKSLTGVSVLSHETRI